MKKLILALSAIPLSLAFSGAALAADTNSPSIDGNKAWSGGNQIINDIVGVTYTSDGSKSLTFSSSNSEGNGSANGNNAVVASQDLKATNSNRYLNDVVDMSTGGSSEGRHHHNGGGSGGDYASGDNSISGGAFAAFAGVLNQAWNTGINSNAQSATNIAAQGNISFGNAQ